jgi:hypothetical protein
MCSIITDGFQAVEMHVIREASIMMESCCEFVQYDNPRSLSYNKLCKNSSMAGLYYLAIVDRINVYKEPWKP